MEYPKICFKAKSEKKNVMAEKLQKLTKINYIKCNNIRVYYIRTYGETYVKVTSFSLCAALWHCFTLVASWLCTWLTFRGAGSNSIDLRWGQGRWAPRNRLTLNRPRSWETGCHDLGLPLSPQVLMLRGVNWATAPSDAPWYDTFLHR